MQKQIEKMAKIIGENSWEGITRPECYVCAEALYNIGYTQPIKDGDVVLSSREKLELYKEAYEQGKFDANAEIAVGEKVVVSRAEYEALQSDLINTEMNLQHITKEYEQTRKETAQTIWKEYKIFREFDGKMETFEKWLQIAFGVEVE